MALKPTIYKFRIALTDLNRDYYDSLSLTVALHPSENLPRMMARILAFCIHASPELCFTKGLSTSDEPDIWVKELDDTISLWVDVGEPEPERIKKASRLANKVMVYSFNAKSETWWKQNQGKLELLDASIIRFDAKAMEMLASYMNRTMDLSVMLSGQSAYVSSESGNCEVTWQELKA